MRKALMCAAGCVIMLTCCRSRQADTPGEKGTVPPVEVKAEVDKSTATTGDIIRYTLSSSSDPATRVEIPRWVRRSPA